MSIIYSFLTKKSIYLFRFYHLWFRLYFVSSVLECIIHLSAPDIWIQTEKGPKDQCFSVLFLPGFYLEWQIGKIFRHKYLVIIFWKCIFHNRIPLICTKYDTNGLHISLIHHFTRVIIHIHLHLPQILKSQFAHIHKTKKLNNQYFFTAVDFSTHICYNVQSFTKNFQVVLF